VSTALPTYSFDNLGAPLSTLSLGSMASSSGAADSGRYIQDDLSMTSVMLPDGNSVPLSALAATNGSVYLDSGMLAAGLGSQSQPGAVGGQLTEAFVGGTDSLNLGAGGMVSGNMTSEELTQILQGGSVMLSEMRGSDDEFLRQFDGIVFQQQTNDSTATGHSTQFPEH